MQNAKQFETCTFGELLFCNWCEKHHIEIQRPPSPPMGVRWPDFLIHNHFFNQMLVEVKDIEVDVETDGQLVGRVGKFGAGVRKKIERANPQLKEYIEQQQMGSIPTLLVLADSKIGWISGYDIHAGMYGVPRLHYVVPSDRRLPARFVKQDNDPITRKLKESQNTTISAIAEISDCVSYGSDMQAPILRVYHNYYAQYPLPLGGFSSLGALEYFLTDNPCDISAQWREYHGVVNPFYAKPNLQSHC